MEREKSTFLRRAESSIERNGGKVAIVIGLFKLNLAVVGLGLLSYLVGKEREAKK